MKPFWKSEVHLDEKELKTDLGEGNFIFVGSSTDMFANNVPNEWIRRVLCMCSVFTKNTYLFQTKNSIRFKEFEEVYPPNTIFGITLETNRANNLYNAPPRIERFAQFSALKGRKMVTIEPIMDFDLQDLRNQVFLMKPEFVNIGADSKGHNLPEPSAEKIGQLIKELKKFTKVNLKDNLKRIYSTE